jgi:transposase
LRRGAVGAERVPSLAGTVVPNAALALEGKRPERDQNQRVEKLEQKLRQKDEVLAELMVEHLTLKKELGEL